MVAFFRVDLQNARRMEMSVVEAKSNTVPKGSASSRHRPPKKQDSKKSAVVLPSPMLCVICADENVKYAALGPCDHSICSFCSLRIRVKSQDKNCPLCKQYMEIVVVYATQSRNLPSYASFDLLGMDYPAPGLDIDQRAGIVFADCKDHFREMDKIRSIICPMKKCTLRFPTDDALLKHMASAHAGHNLCSLCLKNRPLFISEHKVMSNASLKEHMNAPPGALTGAGGDKTAGHPPCLFCNQHFFDSHALYLHMKQEHQSCHLCPTNYQFRFYPSIEELRTHLHDEHFVCSICEKASQNGEEGPGVFGSSFRHHSEYSTHLHTMHGVRNQSVTLGFRVGYDGHGHDGGRDDKRNGKAKSKRASNQLSFLDLDMASADPNRGSASQTQNRNRQGQGGRSNNRPVTDVVSSAVTPEDVATNEARRRQLFHLQTSAAIAAAPMVPAHMRVAGRIVAGRFQRDADDDNLQAAADEQALIAAAMGGASSGGPRGATGWSMRPGNPRNMNIAFPALSTTTLASSSRPNQSEETKSTATHHPMSLVSGLQRDAAAKRAVEEEARIKAAELEDKRKKRNAMMAGALGVGRSDTTAIGLAAESTESFNPTEMMKPLFPPTLLTWAKNNKLELQKLEKKLTELINDKRANSAQLKPMGPASRNAVHGLSRYYYLNSYEFDPEPNRYISLVKCVDSSLPLIRLSTASAMAPLPPSNMLAAMDVPIIALSLVNPTSGFAATDAVNEGKSRKKATEDAVTLAAGGNITAGDIVGRIRAVIKSQSLLHHPYSLPNSHQIVSMKPGASSVI